MGLAPRLYRASNVIPFRRRNASHWFYICDETEQQGAIESIAFGHGISSIRSKLEIQKAFHSLSPSLIIIRSDLKWTNPIDLVHSLSAFSTSPILLILPKRKTKKDEILIKEAFQAGIIDILEFPLGEDAKETVQLVLRLSNRILNLVF
jgi:hypothetical protein